MNDQNSQIAPFSIETLTFDTFKRNPTRDIVCVTPVRTIVRREEEIVLIRKVRKVEEIDASPACPVNTTHLAPVHHDGNVVFEETKVEA